MIEKNLHELINQYEQDMFDNKDADEGNRHIWEAVRHFQDTWFSDNASSMTFTDLFGESIEDNSMYLNSHILSPLTRVTRSINNRHLSPVTGILKMAQQCPEKVENLFRNILFADYCSISELQEHVNIFLEETEALRKMYFPAFYKYKQNRYAASCYLTFFAPEKHYIYCYREAKEFAEYINYKNAELKSGLLGLEEYYELADIIVKALKEHPSLIEKYNTFFENNNKYYFDKSLHLLAIDLMYCSRWHNYYIVLESARRIEFRKMMEERISKERLAARQLKRDKLADLIHSLDVEIDVYRDISLLEVEVSHSRFGIGTIVEQEGNRITVQFSERSSIFVLSSKYPNGPHFEGDKDVIASFTELDRLREKKQRLEKDQREDRLLMENQEGDKNPAPTNDRVEMFINEFEDFHLSEVGKRELRGYFRYLLQKEIRNIPYHFIFQTDTYELASDFTDKFVRVIEKIRGESPKITRFTEYTLLDKPATDRYDACDILIVRTCLSDEQYYPSDEDSSSDKGRKLEYNYRWNQIMDYFGKLPGKTIIIWGPPNIVRGRIRSNTRMYYHFFKHRVFLGNMTEEEIYEKTLQRIDREIGRYSLDFPSKLKEYIYTVYPKSDLKNRGFINDLFESMVALSFEKIGCCDYFNENSIPSYHKRESLDSIEEEFKSLVGLENIKETFLDIGRLCQNMPKEGSEQPYLHMVFRGNPGTGKTTVARFIARLLSAMGVIKRNHVEEVMTADLLGQYTGQTGPKVNRALKRAEGGVLVIDEAYLLTPKSGDTFREECVGTLNKAMENRNDPVIIFAGYPKEMDNFLQSNPGLSSRIGYKLTFEDYTNDQLTAIFKSMCEKAGYDYDDRTIEAVCRKIIALRYEENFGNARTVENIFGQAVSECLRTDPKSRFIKAEHIKIGTSIKTLDELLNELNSMVGIENAKRIIKEQIFSCRFSKEQEKERPVSNNMVFVGNAGTGKTTTAKLFSEMLFSVGVSKSPRAKLITAKDLYVQDVAAKLNGYCNDAMGGVLFIDEIYLLQSNMYLCTEVISVLLEILEDRKEDITIILAGYEEQMSSFLDENQGLKSRFPITVFFDDFTEEELCQIFVQECQAGDMTVSEEAMSQFRKIIRAEMKKDNFGNGRTVRNIYEQAFRKHAVNYYENTDMDPDTFTADDIGELADVDGRKKTIGFIG